MMVNNPGHHFVDFRRDLEPESALEHLTCIGIGKQETFPVKDESPSNCSKETSSAFGRLLVARLSTITFTCRMVFRVHSPSEGDQARPVVVDKHET